MSGLAVFALFYMLGPKITQFFNKKYQMFVPFWIKFIVNQHLSSLYVGLESNFTYIIIPTLSATYREEISYFYFISGTIFWHVGLNKVIRC